MRNTVLLEDFRRLLGCDSLMHYSVMYIKFTHGFILDRNLNILLISYPERDRTVTAAEVSNTYQFITLLCLNPAVT